MRLNKWTVVIILMVCINGCIEPYEPDIGESDQVLVIEGHLTDVDSIHTISVSISSPYSNPLFKPVSGCVVVVEDETGSSMTFQENRAGRYQSVPEPDFLSAGKAYKLTVVTPGVERYESEYDSLLACAPIDSLSFRVEEQGTSNPDINHYGVRFYLDMTGHMEEARSYMWTFEETWAYLAYYKLQYAYDGITLVQYTPQLYGVERCYYTEALRNFQVGSSNLSGSNEIRQQPLYFVSNQTPRLAARYSLLVYQHSLSRGAFRYWDKLRSQSGDIGGLYETQPSRAASNIYNVNHPEEKVLGYFYVSQVRQKRITVSENWEFPISFFNCPRDTVNSMQEFTFDFPYFMYSGNEETGFGAPYVYSYRECFDCTYRGGVTTKPEYWDY